MWDVVDAPRVHDEALNARETPRLRDWADMAKRGDEWVRVSRPAVSSVGDENEYSGRK